MSKLQFLSSWQGGIRSNRITWKKRDSRLAFRTYPMLHIGSREFYEEVSEQLARADFVLVEGVDWTRSGKGGPLYDLTAKTLGLATERRFLIAPSHQAVINIDMPHTTFLGAFKKLSFLSRLYLRFARYIYWWWAEQVVSIPRARKIVLDRWANLVKKSPLTDRDELLITRRDTYIARNLRAFAGDHEDVEQDSMATIVFGAGHMPAIAACLRDLGYRIVEKTWMDVVLPSDYLDFSPTG